MADSRPFWTEASIAMYDRACRFFDYPRIPLESCLDQLTLPTDIVMDIGGGSGALADLLAPKCEHIHVVEPDPAAYMFMQKRFARQSYSNISLHSEAWPSDALPDCDILIALLVYAIYSDAQMMRFFVQKSRRGGCLVLPGPPICNPMREELMQRLMVEPEPVYCSNGCLVRGMLQMLGVHTECRQVTHDFGQPVQNEAEAANFLIRRFDLNATQKDRMRRIAHEYIQYKDGTAYVPNQRNDCVVTFRK